MEVSNRPEGGAQFELRLPITLSRVTVDESGARQKMTLDASRRILLVDDEELIAKLRSSFSTAC